MSEIGIDLDELEKEEENASSEECTAKSAEETPVQKEQEENSETAPCSTEENSETVPCSTEGNSETAPCPAEENSEKVPSQTEDNPQSAPDDQKNTSKDVIAVEGVSLSTENAASKKQSRKFSFKKGSSNKKTKKV